MTLLLFHDVGTRPSMLTLPLFLGCGGVVYPLHSVQCEVEGGHGVSDVAHRTLVMEGDQLVVTFVPDVGHVVKSVSRWQMEVRGS